MCGALFYGVQIRLDDVRVHAAVDRDVLRVRVYHNYYYVCVNDYGARVQSTVCAAVLCSASARL